MTHRPALLLAALLLSALPAGAEEQQELSYVLGAGLAHGPEYPGARRSDSGPTLLWALRWGRWRISTSGAGALLGFGREIAGPGASTELFSDDKFSLGLSLRMDSGRDSGDASSTSGLPDVRRTLRGRLFARYELAPDWLLAGAVSQDLMGRQGGLQTQLDLGWRLHRSESSEWTLGLGLSAADGRNMRSYFGVTPAGAIASGLPEYRPGAGLRDVHAGLGWTRSLGPHWVVYATGGFSRLLGPAADSPLSQRPSGSHFGLGLAYRN